MNLEGIDQPTIRDIASRLELDVKTVRERKKNLDREFVQGYYIMPNTRLFGRRLAVYLLPFEEPGPKTEATSKLTLLDEVVRVDECLRSVAVHLMYRRDDDLQRLLALVRELSGVHPKKVYDYPMPEVRLRLSDLDWRIIQSMRNDPSKSYEQVANEMGITSRTVRNRMGRLIREEAVFKLPILDTGGVSGMVMYVLYCFFKDGAGEHALSELQRALTRRFVCHMTPSPFSALVGIAAMAMGEPEETYNDVRALEGVSFVQLDFPKERHDCSATIDTMIAEEIGRRNAG